MLERQILCNVKQFSSSIFPAYIELIEECYIHGFAEQVKVYGLLHWKKKRNFTEFFKKIS
jgi:hypothetical protein